MTAAERLRQEGRDEGLKEGRDEGLKEGRRRQAAMLLNMLRARFGELPADVRARVEAAEAESLSRWGVRFATAERLDDLFD